MDQFLDLPFSEKELNFAISAVNTRSFPGVDRIDYHIISKFSPLGKSVLLKLYNQMYEQSVIPDEWRSYLVHFIPKADSNKCRPISLSSCLGKIMERMLSNRLHWWLENNGLLSTSQFGFRKGKSCIDNLAILYSEILRGFDEKRKVPDAFLDIKSAYDNVLLDILGNKLLEIGIPSTARSFIFNMIRERKVTCRYHEINEVKVTYKGLPQGSVLSPILHIVRQSHRRMLQEKVENVTIRR